MRVRGLLLALVLVVSACSATPEPEDAASNASNEANAEVGDGGEALAADAGSNDGEDSDSGASGEQPGRQVIESSDADDADDAESTAGTTSDATDNGEAPEGVAFEEPTNDEPTATDQATDGSTSQSNSTAPKTEFDLLVDDLIAFVEAERGYSFQSRPPIELLGEADFGAAWTALIAEDVAESPADYVNYTDIYRALGIIEGDRSLEEIWQRFGDAGVIGFYDQDTGGITLRAGEVNAFTETVLVHELVHALEDQIFDLDRPEYDDSSSELEWTFSALIEGSARRIESNYRATFSSTKLGEETEARRALPRSVSLAEFNNSFLELQFGRYSYGEQFATTLWSNEKDTLDDAFVDPPETSEAILDPSAYLAGAETSGLSAPPAGGDVFESGVWGQAGWAALLTDFTSQADALDIADGWNGDSFVAWREGSQTCVRAHLAGDSPADLDEYAAALEAWAQLAAGREIFYPTADLIRVTACG